MKTVFRMEFTLNSEISGVQKDKLEKVLFILNNFYVGDACYHELSVLSNGLPKSYLVKTTS